MCSHEFLQSIRNKRCIELKMNQEVLANFGTAVHELFIRWDALKLAVEHMGGRNGQQVRGNVHTNTLVEELQLNFAKIKFNLFRSISSQTAREIKDYVFNYCTQNDNIHVSELVEILNEIMDDEFNTICEDNSTNGMLKIIHIFNLEMTSSTDDSHFFQN